MAARAGLIVSLAAVVALLALTVWRDGAAWRAWLAAAALCAAAPSGAAGAAMMTRLIPGAWREPLQPPLARLMGLWPLALLAMAPALLSPGSVYPWPHEAQATLFRKVYMSAPFFLARGVGWFALLAIVAWRLSRGRAVRASTIGLLVYAPFGAMVWADWLMSLDTGFASSGYGLYLLAAQVQLALALAIALAAPRVEAARVRGILAGVLFAATAVWIYLAFMQYFILWSGDLPANAVWLGRRGGAWAALTTLAVALKATPVVLFGLPALRTSGRLSALAWVCAAGAAPEFAWLALPAPGPAANAATVALFLATGTALALAAWFWPLGRRSAS